MAPLHAAASNGLAARNDRQALVNCWYPTLPPTYLKLLWRENKNKIREHRLAIGVAASAVVAASALLAYRYYYYYYRRTKKSRKGAPGLPPCPESVPPAVYQAFARAVERIQDLEHLKTGDKLMLYALYKQVTVGDAPAQFAVSGLNIMVEKMKYDSWSRMRGMSPEEAAVHYITATTALEQQENDDTDEEDEATAFGAPAVSRPVDEETNISTSETTPEARFLAAASDNQKVPILQTLLPTITSINYADNLGQTALHMAADRGANACVQFLLQHGADVRAADEDGISVLQAAVIAGHTETCRILWQHGADPHQPDVDGDTPWSCAQDDDEMVALFESGVSSSSSSSAV